MDEPWREALGSFCDRAASATWTEHQLAVEYLAFEKDLVATTNNVATSAIRAALPKDLVNAIIAGCSPDDIKDAQSRAKLQKSCAVWKVSAHHCLFLLDCQSNGRRFFASLYKLAGVQSDWQTATQAILRFSKSRIDGNNCPRGVSYSPNLVPHDVKMAIAEAEAKRDASTPTTEDSAISLDPALWRADSEASTVIVAQPRLGGASPDNTPAPAPDSSLATRGNRKNLLQHDTPTVAGDPLAAIGEPSTTIDDKSTAANDAWIDTDETSAHLGTWRDNSPIARGRVLGNLDQTLLTNKFLLDKPAKPSDLPAKPNNHKGPAVSPAEPEDATSGPLEPPFEGIPSSFLPTDGSA